MLHMPQDCISTNLGDYLSPESVAGVVWDEAILHELRHAYNDQDFDTLKAALAARDPSDDLAQPDPNGTPYPYTNVIGSWYDGFQPAREAILAYDLVPPPPATPGVPDKYITLTGGHPGHTDPPWQGSAAFRADESGEWLFDYLYLPPQTAPTPTPTTGPTPTPPDHVSYVVDSFNNNPPNLTPTIEVYTDTVWPPADTTILDLYLRAGGMALPGLPELGEQPYDLVGQVLTDTTYTVQAAISETVIFSGWVNSFLTTTQVYTSPPLAQDVTLVGPLTATLYVEPVDSQMTTYQVHVRVKDQIGGSDTVPFVTRANACAWEAATVPGYLNGSKPIFGEVRAHRFKAGDHIVLQLAPIDVEKYKPSTRALFMTPYMGDFSVKVFHELAKPSHVSLSLLLSDPNGAIFQEGGGMAAGMGASQPEGTPPPQPLTLDAYLAYDYTNSGGWRAWSVEVHFTCTGGQAPVTCPETQYLDSEGINQSFVFTATDAGGAVATDSLAGLNIDLTPPQLAESLPETQTFCSTGTLVLDFSVSDALSGVDWSLATFNGEEVEAQANAPLLPGANVLQVDMRDVAGNRVVEKVMVQVNYDVTPDFPATGQTVNPAAPLSFSFTINDACAASGVYGGAMATLSLTGPDGQEQAAVWHDGSLGNAFVHNAATGEYTFDADVSGLAAGMWTARAHLDDGNDYLVTFVVP